MHRYWFNGLKNFQRVSIINVSEFPPVYKNVFNYPNAIHEQSIFVFLNVYMYIGQTRQAVKRLNIVFFIILFFWHNIIVFVAQDGFNPKNMPKVPIQNKYNLWFFMNTQVTRILLKKLWIFPFFCNSNHFPDN